MPPLRYHNFFTTSVANSFSNNPPNSFCSNPNNSIAKAILHKVPDRSPTKSR